MGVRLRLLLLYWLDEEGKIKENKIKEIDNVELHGFWKYKGCSFFPSWCLSVVCGIN
jgi:hypothetical protein